MITRYKNKKRLIEELKQIQKCNSIEEIKEIKEVWSNTPKEVTIIFADTAPVMSGKYYQLLFGNGTGLSLE